MYVINNDGEVIIMENQTKTNTNERNITSKIIRDDISKGYSHTLQFKAVYNQTTARENKLTETKAKALLAGRFNDIMDLHKEDLLTEANLKELAKNVYEATKGALMLEEVSATIKNTEDPSQKAKKEKFNVKCDWDSISIAESEEKEESLESKELMKGLEKTIATSIDSFLKSEFKGTTIYGDVKSTILSDVKKYLANDMGVKSLNSIVIDKYKDIIDTYGVNKNSYLEKVRNEEEFKNIVEYRNKWNDLCLQKGAEFTENIDAYQAKSDEEKLKEAKKLVEKEIKPYLGKAEFTSDSRNLVAFESYQKAMNEEKNIEEEIKEEIKTEEANMEEKKQVLAELATKMDEYADSKHIAEVETVNQSLVETVEPVEQVEEEKSYAVHIAVTMIVKGVNNVYKEKNNVDLEKQTITNMQNALLAEFGDEKVSKTTIEKRIKELSSNLTNAVADVQSPVEETVTEEEFEDVVETATEQAQATSFPEWLHINKQAQEEIRAFEEQEEELDGEDWGEVELLDKHIAELSVLTEQENCRYSSSDALKHDFKDKVNRVLSSLGMPEVERPARVSALIEKVAKEKPVKGIKFKKNATAYQQEFAKGVLREIRNTEVPYINSNKKACYENFQTCVKTFNEMNSTLNRDELVEIVLSNGVLKDMSHSKVDAFVQRQVKEKYWNIEDFYLDHLKDLTTKDTTELNKELQNNAVSKALYDTANEYGKWYYTSEPDDLADIAKETTREVAYKDIFNSIKNAINHHAELRELLDKFPDAKNDVINHIASEIVLDNTEEKELNGTVLREYVGYSKTNTVAFTKLMDDTATRLVGKFYNDITSEKKASKDTSNEILTAGLTKDEAAKRLREYDDVFNQEVIAKVVLAYEKAGIVDFKEFLDKYFGSRNRNVRNQSVDKLDKEYLGNLKVVKEYFKLDDITLEGENPTYNDKIAVLEARDENAVKNMANYVAYLQAEHPRTLSNYMKIKGTLPCDIQNLMQQSDNKYLQQQIINHYIDLQNKLIGGDNGLDNQNNYAYVKNYKFLRRKDVGVERGSFAKRAGAFFARHWYKLAAVGLLGYLAVSAMLFVPAATSFIGFIGGAALTYAGGAVLNTILLGKLPFFKDLIKNRRISYSLSRREVERSTRRVDEMINGRHKGIAYGLKKIFTFGHYDKNGSIVDRLDRANALLDRLQSMSMKNPKQIKKVYKRIHKLLKAKGDGVLELDNGSRIRYTSGLAKKMAKRLGIDENTAAIETTDRDYVDMFLNNAASDLYYNSTVDYNKGKVLGIFGKTRSVGYAIERLENHDKYYNKESNVWKITNADGSVSYMKLRKNQEPTLKKGQSAEHLSVLENYQDDFNNLVDEGQAIISSTQVLLAKAEKAYANNLRRVHNKMEVDELEQLNAEYLANHKAAQSVMKTRRELKAEIKADYRGIKNDRKSLGDAYEQDKASGYDVDKNATSTIDFTAALDKFDKMSEDEKKEYVSSVPSFKEEDELVHKASKAESEEERIKGANKIIAGREAKMRVILEKIAVANTELTKIEKDKLSNTLEKQADPNNAQVDEKLKKIKELEEFYRAERQKHVKKVMQQFTYNKELVDKDSGVKLTLKEEEIKRYMSDNLEPEL